MHRMETWKKVLFIIIAILVTIRILYIGILGEVDKEYYTSMSYDMNTVIEEIPCRNLSETFVCSETRLNSLELIFSNIPDDETGAIILGIWDKDILVYQTNVSLRSIKNQEWKKIYVNAEMQKNIEYTITLNANKDCTKIPNVLVVSEAAKEIRASYAENKATTGCIAINFGYLRFPGVFDRLSIISLWILFAGAVFYVLYHSEKIGIAIQKGYEHITETVKPSILIVILELFFCIIFINSSGIEFQPPTRVILYAISLISVVKSKEKIAYVKKLANRKVKRIFLCFLYLYSAFALVGQRILIYPLTLKLTTPGIFVYVVTVLWFIPVINTLLYYAEAAWKYSFISQQPCCRQQGMKQIKTPAFITICSLIILIPAIYNLFANNPGISSQDTSVCMITNAQHLHGMYDWHPAFYCMVLRAIQSISNSTYAVIAVQYFFWAYVMIELLLFLRKKGMKESILLCIAIFTGFNAGNFIHINTIWKDIPYTLSLLWAFIILAKLSIDYEEYKYKWYIYLELIISTLGIYLYRKNGVVSFIIIMAFLVIILRKNIKVWISAAITIALIFTIKGPVYDYFDIQDPGRRGIYIGLGQDILGAYYAGGEISNDTLEMITMMTNYNNAEYSYTPTWSRASYDVDVPPSRFVINYLDTFIKNPISMLRAIIAREDALWNIFIGQDAVLGCVNRYATIDNKEGYPWNDYYPERQYVSLYTTMSAATDYTADSQWISAIEWRSGLFTLLGLIAAIFMIFKKGLKKHLLILTPAIGHILGLLLSTGWSDFRYYWPMNLLNLSFIFIVLVIIKQDTENEEGGDA